MNYLNLACGDKLAPSALGWKNYDQTKTSQYVQYINLLKPLPFPSDSADCIYTSQFIEHLQPHQAFVFLSECYRVLRPGGILRTVTPNLEELIHTYLSSLESVSVNQSQYNCLKHEWVYLELFDQVSRNKHGGHMSQFITSNIDNPYLEPLLLERLGRSGIKLISSHRESLTLPAHRSIYRQIKIIARSLLRRIYYQLIPPAYIIGCMRLSGEIHYKLYDYYTLRNLLLKSGFSSVQLMSPTSSNIPNFDQSTLDYSIDLSVPDNPNSLFVESIK